MNDTANTTALDLDRVTASRVYTVVGTLSMLVNTCVFLVLICNWKLMVNSAIIAGITFSHFLNALNIGATGYFRWTHISWLGQPTTAWNCVGLVYPLAYPLELQALGGLLSLAGVERMLAVAAPAWFRRSWTNSRSWAMVVCVFVICVATLFVGIARAHTTTQLITWECIQIDVFGYAFITYSNLVSVVGGVAAVVTTMTAWIIGQKALSSLQSQSREARTLKRQVRLTWAIMTVASLDCLLVVVPCLLSVLTLTGAAKLPIVTNMYSNIAYCVNGSITFIPYVLFNAEFRRAIMKLFYRITGRKMDNITTLQFSRYGGRSVIIP